ncbi:DUF692 domain-containing protein [Rhodanobacter sp. C01]|uniref:MNIO family bufferin maturase n=1 Tax=Rhodanobacter sp. C01 TaxID=1945856 RepID=UPI00098726EF|nr:DUF692 domain-containing protein [Rhodanobacter sp. C01]OOG45468.1 hypothetical protein B0E50_14720 [Rhodanobacter sp. C01]
MTTETNSSKLKLPCLGYGLGLRVEYYEALLENPGHVEWLEVVSENYMIPGGRPLAWLEKFRERFPLAMHGVSMSIGSTDPLDEGYLGRLAELARRVEPAWISDHLCWTGVQGVNLHDLMPLPYTEEALAHVVDRVRRVQDRLGRRILLENVSSYISFADSQLTEWQFLAAVAERADCLILLDINNIHVSAHNHGFSPLDYLDGIPAARVQQFHLAGHEHGEHLLIDTHDAPVVDAVWDLYIEAVRRYGRVSTMIERDDHMPPLAELLAELDHARLLAMSLLQAAA